MKLIQYMIFGLTMVLIMASCRQTREIQSPAATSKSQWTIQKPAQENPNRYFDGSTPTVCFPGLSEFHHDIISFEAKVYNRWGSLMFETKTMDANWICNQNETQSIPAGSYFFAVKYQERSGSEAIEESGLIVIASE